MGYHIGCMGSNIEITKTYQKEQLTYTYFYLLDSALIGGGAEKLNNDYLTIFFFNFQYLDETIL